MSERHDDSDASSGRVATVLIENEKPIYSRLLGPNGKPLEYERQSIGFDLKPRQTGSTGVRY